MSGFRGNTLSARNGFCYREAGIERLEARNVPLAARCSFTVFLIDFIMWRPRMHHRKGTSLNLDPTKIEMANSPLPVKVEEFLCWVQERHGELVSNQCREKIRQNMLWDKPIDPVRVLNDIVYPADRTFQSSKVGKIKFVV
jgi:hypothetical protein